MISSLVLFVLSYYEHSRAVQPSTLISVYLLLSLVFNAARTRTLWQMGVKPGIASLFSASLAVNVLLLLLESLDKSKYLGVGDGKYGPEDTGGFINRTLFFWMNRLICTGYRRSLSLGDIYQLPNKFADGSLQFRWQGYWSKGRPVCSPIWYSNNLANEYWFSSIQERKIPVDLVDSASTEVAASPTDPPKVVFNWLYYLAASPSPPYDSFSGRICKGRRRHKHWLWLSRSIWCSISWRRCKSNIAFISLVGTTKLVL